jgi:hypothetical protein
MFTNPKDYDVSENYWQGGQALDYSEVPFGATVDFSRPAHLRGEVSFADQRSAIEAETRVRALNKIIVEQYEPPLIGSEIAMLTGMILQDRLVSDQALVDAVNSSRERFNPEPPPSQPQYSQGHKWSDYRQKFAQRH